MLAMDCICIFWDSQLEKLPKHYLFYIIKRSHHVSNWKWMQTYKSAKLSSKRRKISEFVVDETMIQVGS
jgi:hypothetical protein